MVWADAGRGRRTLGCAPAQPRPAAVSGVWEALAAARRHVDTDRPLSMPADSGQSQARSLERDEIEGGSSVRGQLARLRGDAGHFLQRQDRQSQVGEDRHRPGRRPLAHPPGGFGQRSVADPMQAILDGTPILPIHLQQGLQRRLLRPQIRDQIRDRRLPLLAGLDEFDFPTDPSGSLLTFGRMQP